MVPGEKKNNAYAKFGGTSKEYYGIFRKWPIRLAFFRAYIILTGIGREFKQ